MQHHLEPVDFTTRRGIVARVPGHLSRLVAASTFWVAGCASGGPSGIEHICDGVDLSATVVEMAATPREDSLAELLALQLGTTAVAEESMYQRTRRDLDSIRGIAGDVRGRSPETGIVVSLVDASQLARLEGEVPAWGCRNDRYRYSAWTPELHPDRVYLSTNALLDTAPIAREYASIPGVESAEPSSSIGDGPRACATVVGEDAHYLFDGAGGDCPSGCNEFQVRHFQVSAIGVADLVEEWEWTGLERGRFDPPAWVFEWGRCIPRFAPAERPEG